MTHKTRIKLRAIWELIWADEWAIEAHNERYSFYARYVVPEEEKLQDAAVKEAKNILNQNK